MKYIKTSQIQKGDIVIDVLGDKSFENEHLKGARNFCIYEINFKENIENSFVFKGIKLIIYGFSNKTKEAELAYETLTKLGYDNVYIIDGGLIELKSNEFPIEGLGKNEVLNGEYKLDKEKTRIEWTGRNIGNKHTGGISAEKGKFIFDEGNLISGKIILDMNTITNFDIKNEEYSNILVNHLKGEDFFDVEKFPEAKLKILEVEKLKGVGSKPNCKLTAEFTIKGITNKIKFKAEINLKEGNLVINTHLDIDRSKFGIMYGSEKFFARLGGHIISDIISLDVIIYANKKETT